MFGFDAYVPYAIGAGVEPGMACCRVVMEPTSPAFPMSPWEISSLCILFIQKNPNAASSTLDRLPTLNKKDREAPNLRYPCPAASPVRESSDDMSASRKFYNAYNEKVGNSIKSSKTGLLNRSLSFSVVQRGFLEMHKYFFT